MTTSVNPSSNNPLSDLPEIFFDLKHAKTIQKCFLIIDIALHSMQKKGLPLTDKEGEKYSVAIRENPLFCFGVKKQMAESLWNILADLRFTHAYYLSKSKWKYHQT